MKRQQRTRPTPHSRQLHEEAFDLYCAGLSCPQVGATLRERYGAEAPHYNTIKRWMVQDRWPTRRQAIRQHTTRLNDRLRATEDTQLIASLTGLRETLVAAAGSELPFRSAEGAVFSLAAVQKVIDRLSRSAAGESSDLSGEQLDLVVEMVIRLLQEDEVVGAALDQRLPEIMDRAERYLDGRPSRPSNGPDGHKKEMGLP